MENSVIDETFAKIFSPSVIAEKDGCKRALNDARIGFILIRDVAKSRDIVAKDARRAIWEKCDTYLRLIDRAIQK